MRFSEIANIVGRFMTCGVTDAPAAPGGLTANKVRGRWFFDWSPSRQ